GAVEHRLGRHGVGDRPIAHPDPRAAALGARPTSTARHDHARRLAPYAARVERDARLPQRRGEPSRRRCASAVDLDRHAYIKSQAVRESIPDYRLWEFSE